MKKLIAIAALATAAVAAPASAGTLTGEVRFGDLATSGADSTEYRLEYWDSIGAVNVGAELQTKQAQDAGVLGSKISLKAGPKLPEVAGLQVNAYGEVGKNLAEGANFEFWGASVRANKQIIGPLSLNAGYRHRASFDGPSEFNENRLDAGLTYDVTDKLGVGVSYYRTTGTVRYDTIGASVTRKF